MYTNQEIFNKTHKHLLGQNKKSISTEGYCKYRGPNNLKCAIGPFISDKLYDKDMEGKSVQGLFDDFPKVMSQLFYKEQLPFLRALQHIHDHTNIDNWRSTLEILAISHNLDY